MSDKASDSSANYVLLAKLADEFAARYRNGERPALQEYIDRHPELADDIREMFPAMVEIEQAGEDHHEAVEQSTPVSPALQQLGDYRIIREVGKGGMGIVYEAEQVSLGRHVALKLLPKSMLVDAKAKRRFVREAKSAAKLHHTNIVPVFGVGEQDGLPYYVMQFIQGLGLDEVLEELRKLHIGNAKTGTFVGSDLRVARKELSAVNVARSLLTGDLQWTGEKNDDGAALVAIDGTRNEDHSAQTDRSPALSDSFTLSSSSVVLPGRGRDGSKSKNKKPTYWQSVASIGVQVADALEYAHKQGINHRDIKPSNLLLDTQGTVWVTDFGLAKADDQQNLTHTGDILGTLRYMPPEAFEGKTDARSDVYSLGLTLFEMLAFRPAFDEKDRNRLIKQVTNEEPARLSKLNRQVPQDLETIVHKAIDKDPSRRYATASALAEDLQRFVDDEPIKARRVSQTERFWRWCRRNPALASAIGLAAMALLSVTIVSTLLAITQANFANHQTQSNTDLRQEQERTKAALQESKQLGIELDSKLRELRKNSALAAVERGQSLIDQGQVRRGMLWLTRGLELAPAEMHDLQHAVRTSLAGFRGDISILRATFPTSYTVTTASISPDGKTIAYGGLDFSSRQGQAELRDLASGKRIGPVLEHRSVIESVAFSKDSKTLVTGSGDGTARLWDVATGNPLSIPALNHQGAVYGAFFSPDGKTIVTFGTGDYVRLWDAANGQAMPQKLSQPGPVESVAFSPDSKSLLVAGSQLILWDFVTGKERRYPHAQRIGAVGFSPDGKTFATGSDTTVKLWDVATGKPVGKPLDHQSPVLGLAFNPDGRIILSSGGGVVRLWDVETSEAQGEPLEGPTGYFYGAGFSSDGQCILLPGRDHAVRLWSLSEGRQTRAPLPQTGPVRRLEFDRDGKSLLVLSGEGNVFGLGSNADVRVWNLLAGKPIGPALRTSGFPHSVALSPNGRTIMMADVGHGWGSFRLWDAIASKSIGEPIPVSRIPITAAFSHDGKTILLGSYDRTLAKGTAQLVDAASGKVIAPSLDLPGPIRDAVFSQDDRMILTLSVQFLAQVSEIRLWDARTGKTIGPGLRFQGAVLVLAFSPDNKTILSGGDDRAAHFLDAATGKPIGLPLIHRGKVNAVAFCPDGKIAATASDDMTVRLWDVATGLPLGPPLRHHGAVSALAFSPDGTSLVSGGADKMIRFWRIPPPLSGQTEELTALVEAAGGKTLSPEGMTNDLETAAWQTQLEKLASGTHSSVDFMHAVNPLPGEGLSWHQHQALDSMEAENSQASLWHLDRQIRAQHEDWLSHVFRTRVNLQLDHPDLAAADLARAFDLGPAEQVLNWYQCFAAERADKEQWQAAAWYLDRLIERFPKDSAPYVQRARASVKKNRWKEAVPDYAKAVELSPAQPQMWLEKAEFEFDHGQLKDAAKAFAEALNLDPADHWTWYQSAALHLYSGDLDGYRRHCREMLRRFGQTNDPQIAERIAKTCLLRPDAVEDQKSLQRLAELTVANTEKDQFRAFFMLAKGMAEYRAGNPEQAAVWLRNIGNTLSQPVYGSLIQLFESMAYHRMGWSTEAREALQKARTLIDAEHERWKKENASQGNADWLRAMSVLPEAEALLNAPGRREMEISLQKRHWAEAIRNLDQLIKVDPDFWPDRARRSFALAESGRAAEAAAEFSRVTALVPRSPQPFMMRCHFYLWLGKPALAAKDYSAALNLDPSDHLSWHESAALHLYVGDLDGYRRHCREMLARFGQTDDPMIAERTAKTCLLRPDAVEDQKLVQKLAELAVTNTEKHGAYGWFMLIKGIAEYRAGNPEHAVEWLAKSLKSPSASYPPFNPMAQIFLAMSFQRLGREKEARETLQQARGLIDAELEKWQREDASKYVGDWLRAISVLPEAEALINGPASPSKK